MLTPTSILNERVRDKILEQVNALGEEAALCYAQRVVGQPETGGLTPTQAELINACNPDNFLRCYHNICAAHTLRS